MSGSKFDPKPELRLFELGIMHITIILILLASTVKEKVARKPALLRGPPKVLDTVCSPPTLPAR